MDSLDQAIYDIVHKSDIKAKGIADRLGMTHQILINKANPNSEHHKMTVREAHAIQLLTGNHAVVGAMQTELNIHKRKAAPKSILQSVLDAGKEHGDVLATIQEAMADGILTEREKGDICKEIREEVAALEDLLESVMSQDRVLSIAKA